VASESARPISQVLTDYLSQFHRRQHAYRQAEGQREGDVGDRPTA